MRHRPECPAPELVQAARARTLPRALQERIDTHVADCGTCRTLGEALEDHDVSQITAAERARVRQRVLAGISEEKRATARRRVWRWSAAAALIMLAAADATVLWPNKPSVYRVSVGELLGVARTAGSDVVEMLAPVRDAKSPEAADTAARQARKSLAALAARSPHRAATQLSLGVTNLFLGQDYTAVPALELAEAAAKNDGPGPAQAASWYLALAYVRIGQLNLGRPRLDALCNTPGNYSNWACKGLAELSRPIRLSGIVTGPDGKPLTGVTVGQHLLRSDDVYLVTEPTRFSAVTDDSGRYTILDEPVSLERMPIIRAAKPGYFTATAGVMMGRDAHVEFRLEPWRHIRLGDTISGIIGSEELKCGQDRCHEYAVTVATSGTLEVSVNAPQTGQMDLYVETPGGEIYGPQLDAPKRVALPATAGSTFQIRVLSFTADPHQYALTTRMR